MKALPGQLSLPLFEPEPAERDEDRPEAHTPHAHRAVVSSHSQSQAAQPTGPPKSPAESASTELLTTGEAAELLNVHPRTVQRLVERGELAAVHLGSAVRFDPLDLAGLVARLKRHDPQPGAPLAASVDNRGRAPASFADRLRSQQHEHRAAPA